MADELSGEEAQRRALDLSAWDLGAFLWGLAEGTLFFIVPDVLISLGAMQSLRRGLRMSMAALAGALLGGTLMFAWARRDVEGCRHVLLKVPLVRAGMMQAVARDYAELGPWAIARGPLTGKPYKLYAAHAGASGGSLVNFWLESIPGRLWRFLLTASGAALLGHLLRKAVNFRLAILALFWLGTYVALARAVGRVWGN